MKPSVACMALLVLAPLARLAAAEEYCPACRPPMFLSYHSEQERLLNDCCADCPFNWGDMGHPFGALAARFQPQWYAHAEGLFLFRDKINHVDIASLTPGIDNVVLDTDEFGICIEAGGRVSVARTVADRLALEGVLFATNEFSGNKSVRDASPNPFGAVGNLYSPFSDFGMPPQLGLDYNTLATVTFSSELQSAELNLRHRFGVLCGPFETALLYGVRYMKIDEGFSYLTQSGVPAIAGSTNFAEVQTSNDLFGMQIGGTIGYRVSDRWWIDFDAKAALCVNDTSQSTSYTNVNNLGLATNFNGTAQTDCTAFIGELNLMSHYHLTPAVTITGGYVALFVDGLALAEENFVPNVAVLTAGPAQVHDRGATIYHGPHMGLTYAW